MAMPPAASWSPGPTDKTIRVWSAEDGRLQRTIRIPAGPGNVGQIYAVAMSPDGGTIAASGWTSVGGSDNIYLFERATGREIGRIGELPNVSPSPGLLAGWQQTRGGDSGRQRGPPVRCAVLAADSGRTRTTGSDSYGLAFAPDGRIATTSFDGKIRLYGPMLDKRQTVPGAGRQAPDGIAFSPDGSRIAIRL